MQNIETTTAQWAVFVFMRRVLLKVGAQHPTQQAASRGNAWGDSEAPQEPWPGAYLGVRQPGIDETPLSESERWIVVREGW